MKRVSKPISTGLLATLSLLIVWSLEPKPLLAANNSCNFSFVKSPSPFLHASFQLTAVPKGNVKVTFVGHSTFVLESPAGITLATDFNGIHTPKNPPLIITMNNSHSSHYTDVFNPETMHVLRGWDPDGGIAKHDLKLKDMRVYNIPTNIKKFHDRTANENSIFVIESNGLCFAHVGHLQHVIGADQSRNLGRIDVLFVPIDGLMTMSFNEAVLSIEQIAPKLVIPMHYFGVSDSQEFLQFLGDRYPIKSSTQTSAFINRHTLPKSTEILLLNAEFWSSTASEN